MPEDITLCGLELLRLSDKAGCQTEKLLVRFLDVPLGPQACKAPSLSAAAEHCCAARADSLCTRLFVVTHIMLTLLLAHLPLFIHLAAHFQPRWEPEITLHLLQCANTLKHYWPLSCPALAAAGLAAFPDHFLHRNAPFSSRLGLGWLCCLVTPLE